MLVLQVTKAAYHSIVHDLKRQVQIDAKLFPKRCYGSRVATLFRAHVLCAGLFAGVQIHGPDATDWIWCVASLLALVVHSHSFSCRCPYAELLAGDKFTPIVMEKLETSDDDSVREHR